MELGKIKALDMQLAIMAKEGRKKYNNFVQHH
jgi:hypothetical protein